MATELGQAYVQIMPSARGISGSIQKQLDPEATAAGKSAGSKIATGMKVAVAAAAAAVGAAVAKVVSESVSEGAKLEQSIGGIETLFNDSADTVLKNADIAYRTAGTSANEYMEQVTSFSASLLQSLGGDTDEAAKVSNMAMIDMADNMNKMGTPLQDIQNAYQGFAKENYTMLDNLKLGYGGTKTEMERLLADATKLTGVKYDINNLADVYNAIHAIQEEMGITGTTALEAEETVSGSFAAMAASLRNVLGNMALGENIQPSLSALAQTTSTFLFDNFLPMVGRVLGNLPTVIGGFLTEFAPFLAQAGTQMMEQLGIGIGSGMDGIFTKIQATLQPIVGAFQTAFGQLPGMFQTVVASITPIIDTIAIAFTKLDFSGLQAVITAIIPAITNAFSVMMSIVSPAIDMVVNSFVSMWNAAQPLISTLASALMPVLQILGAFLGGVFKGILIGVSAAFGVVTTVIKILTPVVQWLVEKFQAITPVLTKVAEWVGVVIGLFANLGSSGTSLGNILRSAWTNIRTAVTTAGNIIKGAIGGIRTVFTALGSAGGSLRNVLSTAWSAIRTAISSAGGAIRTAINGVRSVFTNLSSAGSSLRTALSAAWNGIRSAVSSAGASITRIVNNIKNIFNSLKNIDISGAGTAIMEGFLGGLQKAWNGVKDFVGGIGGWIAENKGPISYDRKLLIPAGEAIMGGLNKGLVDHFKTVKSTVRNMGDELAEEFKPSVFTDKLNGFKSATFQNEMAHTLSGEFSSDQAISKPRDKREISVTNNNYSPEPLTEREIARQTRLSLQRIAYDL